MKVLIVGAGLGGLVTAGLLKKIDSSTSIDLVESDEVCGGRNYGKFYAGPQLFFDLGTHIPRETGHLGVDALLNDAFWRADDSRPTHGSQALSGLISNGTLQSNSHFLDLRNRSDIEVLRNDLHSTITKNQNSSTADRTSSLRTVAKRRFGHLITDQILLPELENMFRIDRENLAGFALDLAGWSRVIVDAPREWTLRSADQAYRQVVAVPDQRDLPRPFRHNRRDLYHPLLGSRFVIEGLESILKLEGVRFHLGSQVRNLDAANRTAVLTSRGNPDLEIKFDCIVIATGLMGAIKTLGLTHLISSPVEAMRQFVVNVRAGAPVDSDLTYIACSDSSIPWYRVLNYRAITGIQDDHRLTFEFFGAPQESPRLLGKSALLPLVELRLLSSDSIDFVQTEVLRGGFPTPTVENMRNLQQLGMEVSSHTNDFIKVVGTSEEGTLFFQDEILLDAAKKVAQLL